ncbi:MAG: GNAT family N-acetyltransferase [Nanoarchaeota archaeon]|nr:GNAT family N-acetyltransferase [Nanoarchaeota archaeon]
MKITKALKKDIPEMLEIIKINSPEYSKNLALKELNEMFSKSLYKPTYITIKEKNKILAFGGMINSWADNLMFNIFWVNTHPKYQKKGIGTKLIKALIREIKKRKPTPKLITLATDNYPFYQKFGFKKSIIDYHKKYFLMSLKI